MTDPDPEDPGKTTDAVYYHMNGELVPAEEATINVRDRGFLYGDAAFETLRAYGGTVFEREAHHDRLRNSCAALGMAGAVPDDLDERISGTLAANDFEDAYVRVSVTRGVQPGKLTPQPEVDPSIVVIVASLPRGGREGVPVWDDPAVVETVETRAVPDSAIPAGIKTHNYLNGILTRLELRNAGQPAPRADESLLCDESGAITEGATSNLFLVRDGVLCTPSADEPLLSGITRSIVFDLAERTGVPTETGRYTPEDCRSADELFCTNTTWELRLIGQFDGQDLPAGDGAGGPITRELARAFDSLVEERHY